MSNFELRDSLAASGTSTGFSGRVADVFAGLGSGQVKSDKDNDERMKNIKAGTQLKTNLLFLMIVTLSLN